MVYIYDLRKQKPARSRILKEDVIHMEDYFNFLMTDVSVSCLSAWKHFLFSSLTYDELDNTSTCTFTYDPRRTKSRGKGLTCEEAGQESRHECISRTIITVIARVPAEQKFPLQQDLNVPPAGSGRLFGRRGIASSLSSTPDPDTWIIRYPSRRRSDPGSVRRTKHCIHQLSFCIVVTNSKKLSLCISIRKDIHTGRS